MYTIADLKQRLEQFDDDMPIVIKADTKRELYDDADLLDLEERLTFEPVSLMLADDVDCWESDNGELDRLRMKAFSWRNA